MVKIHPHRRTAAKSTKISPYFSIDRFLKLAGERVRSSKNSNSNQNHEIYGLGQCKTLTELKTFLEASDKATAKFDLLLFKGGKVSELMKSFDKVRGESKDFKTASKVRAHVKHREKAGWIFEKKDAESEDPYFKLSKIA